MYMSKIKNISIFSLLFVLITTSCNEKETPIINSGEASLSSIDFDYYGSIFNAKITGNTIILDRLLPYSTASVTIQRINLAENCSSNLKVGDKINVSNNGSQIIVTNTLSKKTTRYQVQLSTRNYISVVDQYGLLQTSGSKIVDKNKMILLKK